MRRRHLLAGAALGGAATLLPSPSSAASAAAASPSADAVGAIRDYLADRAARITGTAAGRAPASVRLDSYSSTMDRLDLVRSRLDALHGGYASAATEVTVTAGSLGATGGVVRVTEHTDLYFRTVAAGSVDHMSYLADHEVTVARGPGGWMVTAAVYLPANAYSVPATQFAEPSTLSPLAAAAFSAEPLSRIDLPAVAAQAKDTGGRASVQAGYNYTAMVNYARQWALGRNPAYPSYSPDCTNFVSQVMRAGGWATVGGWPFSDRGSDANWWWGTADWNSSYSWGGAENFGRFALRSGRTYILSSVWSMGIGDCLEYDFNHDGSKDHIQVCTGWNGSPLMTQHSGEYRDKPLSEILANPTNSNAWLYAHRT